MARCRKDVIASIFSRHTLHALRRNGWTYIHQKEKQSHPMLSYRVYIKSNPIYLCTRTFESTYAKAVVQGVAALCRLRIVEALRAITDGSASRDVPVRIRRTRRTRSVSCRVLVKSKSARCALLAVLASDRRRVSNAALAVVERVTA